MKLELCLFPGINFFEEFRDERSYFKTSRFKTIIPSLKLITIE